MSITKKTRFSLSLLLAFWVQVDSAGVLAAQATGEEPVSDQQALPHSKRRSSRRYIPGSLLTQDTLELARMLQIEEAMDELKALVRTAGEKPSSDALVKIIYLRQKCARAVQYASLELEEALAYIDGDLSYTNMEYSLLAAKYNRSIVLNDAATFLTSGALGVLDSASGIKQAAPLPNVFGITGNAAAIAIPLWGLRPRRYKSMRSEYGANMLAPIFGLSYEGEGYDPIVWRYLNTVALDENSTGTRRQNLLERWKKFRYLSNQGDKKEELEKLAGVSDSHKVTLDLLKTRSELLVELRAEVQSMYADISDLNTEIMKY